MRQSRVLVNSAVIVLFIALTAGCSIKKMAMKQVANALTTSDSSTVFTGDNDPELVGDALPFTIKMYESLMTSIPNHIGLRLQTGRLYIMYANAFLQTPASMMPDEETEKKDFLEQRAKNLYLRGRDIILTTLDHKYPGFSAKMKAKQYDQALAPTTIKDIDLLYWGAAGWLGAFALDPFDMKMTMTMPGAEAMMKRVLTLSPNYNEGTIHDFYVLYYGSMPENMGGDLKKAREHYHKAIAASGGKITSPHISLATTVAVQEQNIDEFKALLGKVLEVNPDIDPKNRLLNTINQRKARWLLDHAEDLFLTEPGKNIDENSNVKQEEENQ